MADKKISQLTGSTTPLAGTEELPVVQSGVTKKVNVADLTAGRAVAMAFLNAGSGAAIANTVATLGNNTGAPVQWGFVSIENCGGIAPPAAAGLMVGWNYSNGGGETNLVYGTGVGGAPALAIARYNGVTLSESARFTSAGNLAFPSGQGIDFSANTHAAGMTSELLDWYEEGTWTPVLDSATAGSGRATTVTSAKYTRIGNMVTVQCYIKMGTLGSGGSGAWSVKGLPFTSAGSSAYGVANIGYAATLNAAVVNLGGYIAPSSTVITITGSTGASTLPYGDLDFATYVKADTEIIVNATYFV